MKIALPRLCLAALLLGSCGSERLAMPQEEAGGSTAAPGSDASRRIIRTARLSIEVESIDEAVREINQRVTSHRALVTDSNIFRTQRGRQRATLIIQVPDENLQATLESLRELGTITRESVSNRDVTEAYRDLETRIRVKRDTEQRLRGILEHQASKVSDIIEIERELERIVTELEQLTAERLNLDQQTSMSTLTLELSETGPLLDPVALPLGKALSMSGNLFLSSLSMLMIVTVFAAPWFVVIGLVKIAVRKYRMRHRT